MDSFGILFDVNDSFMILIREIESETNQFTNNNNNKLNQIEGKTSLERCNKYFFAKWALDNFLNFVAQIYCSIKKMFLVVFFLKLQSKN